MQRGVERVEKLSALQVHIFISKSPLMYYSVKLIYSHARPPYFDDLKKKSDEVFEKGKKGDRKGQYYI